MKSSYIWLGKQGSRARGQGAQATASMTFVTGDITDIQRIVQWPNVKYFGLIYITVPDETTHFYSSLASAGVSSEIFASSVASSVAFSSLLASSKFSTRSGTSSSSSSPAPATSPSPAPPVTLLASLLRWVRLSAPSWFRIPGSISVICLFSACPVTANVLAAREACTLGLLKWMTDPSSLIMLTSSMPGMLLTESFFRLDWSFLSSVVAVLCTTFFFLLAVPLPPMRTLACSCFSFSGFILNSATIFNYFSKENSESAKLLRLVG